MAITNFPPIDQADEHGLLAVGGDLDIESLLLAYRRGIFPWPISEEYPIAWFSPDPRGIIEYDDLHVSNSLKKILKKNKFDIRFNTNFEGVVRECAGVVRKGQNSTWITEDIVNAYVELFFKGYAYSVECYHGSLLVGGVYGVCIEGIVSGESMFYREDNASKVALVYLLEKLNSVGIKWLDTQMVTPVVKGLGGSEISRESFVDKIKDRVFLTRDEIFN